MFLSCPFSFSTSSFTLRDLGALGFLSAFGLETLGLETLGLETLGLETLGLDSPGLAARLVTGFMSVASPFFLLPLPLVFSSGSHSSGSSSLTGLSSLQYIYMLLFFNVTFC
ncbi:hypothetical protein AMELA_G00048650 [Ameiurus melas]|uniref:Uncharacterized protein n=1 Tax=Ameiurus melas TaxID=219545 RepID=A0A7J6B579_AMEME|nr:hypothetical protein AMELA_G00048650 [Ameiurus melas]